MGDNLVLVDCSKCGTVNVVLKDSDKLDRCLICNSLLVGREYIKVVDEDLQLSLKL